LRSKNYQMKTNLLLFPLISIIFFAFSFTNKDKSPVKVSRKISKTFSFVPSGDVVRNKNTVSVQSFYMQKTEISNKQNTEFLSDLKANKEIQKLKIAAIDTNKWVSEFGDAGLNYATHYHNHIAYANYPVVNITKAGAELYCEWLTAKMKKENPELNIIVRLPVEAEWFRACNPTNNLFPYSMSGFYLRESNGSFIFNFRQLGEANIYYDSISNSFQVKDIRDLVINKVPVKDLTAPVNSYYPSKLGFHHLNGNVAEFIAEGYAMGGSWQSAGYDIRNESRIKTTSASTSVGFRPVFTATQKSLN
jgi:hypothetical protein